MNPKRLIKQFIPPILLPIFKTIYNKFNMWTTGKSYEMEYIPEGWAYTQKHSEIEGWNVTDWVETMIKSSLAIKEMCEGTDPLVPWKQDLATEDALRDHNRMMILAYTLALASRNRNSISILDWGGGLGQYYYLAKALLPGDINIDFYCKDVPFIAEYGSEHVPEIHFYSDDSCLERTYDVVMAHASIYYSQDWKNDFSKLARSSSGYLLVTRMPFVSRVTSYVCLERLYRFGYNVETIGWILNRSSFLSEAEHLNLTLVREFITGQIYQVSGAPEQPIFRGFLFRVQ